MIVISISIGKHFAVEAQQFLLELVQFVRDAGEIVNVVGHGDERRYANVGRVFSKERKFVLISMAMGSRRAQRHQRREPQQ